MRCAVKYRNMNGHSAEQLRSDLLNAPKHCFGDDSACQDYYCKQIGSADNKAGIIETFPLKLQEIIAGQVFEISEKATQLIHDCTTNKAECYISVITKFTGGKRLNLTGRGAYELQVKGAALSLNLGPTWHAQAVQNQGVRVHDILWTIGKRRERAVLTGVISILETMRYHNDKEQPGNG